MIKICSLDFLNREVFETDVMTADGLVLVQSGEKITSDILLRLYFKEIYIAQPLSDKDKIVNKVAAAVLADVVEEAATSEIAIEAEDEFAYEGNNFVVPEIDFAEELKKKKSKKGPKAAQNDAEDDNDDENDEKGPKQAELNLDDVQSPKAAGNKFDLDEEETEEKGKGPKKAKLKFEEDDEDDEDEEDGKGPKKASGVFGLNDEKGPKAAGLNFDSDEEEGEAVKGPIAADLSKYEDDPQEGKASAKSKKSTKSEEEAEVEQIKPEELPLVFDEAQANRIKQYSAQLAKQLGFSKDEIKEIELVAYNCNIGITRFKKADEAKKSFRKMKVFASYEKLMEEETMPQHLAEMIKYIINPYDSDAFKLDSKIPYYHIIAITSFYEEMLAQGKDKSDILLKMLQLGGHQFNIFVLHKFIKMMREAND